MAATFKQDRNVPVYCGEFGVYQPDSAEPDRIRWYETVRTTLETIGVAWTMWDYHGGFGIFLAKSVASSQKRKYAERRTNAYCWQRFSVAPPEFPNAQLSTKWLAASFNVPRIGTFNGRQAKRASL